MARFLVLLGLACFLSASPAWGADSDSASPEERLAAASPVEELESVLVSPSRIPGINLNASEFPGNATVITARQIEALHAASITEVLRRQVGVTVADTHGFGLGADTTVNLRGVVNSSRTGALVLVDGVRQNRLTGDEVHWQSLAPEDIDRIEIIRGGSSLIYGEGALSGVINIITKKGDRRRISGQSGVEAGSFGRFRYFTAFRGTSGPVTYGTSFNRRLVTGYRESTSSRMSATSTHIGVDVHPRLHVETNVLTSEDTTYFPGGVTANQSQQRRRQRGAFSGFIEDHSTQVGLDALWRGPGGLSLAANAFLRDRESDSAAPDRLAAITPSNGLSLRAGHDAAVHSDVRSTFVTGIDLLREKASTGFRTGTYSESNKASYGLYAEETLRLFERASLVMGARYDRSRFAEAITFPDYVGTLRFEGWSPKVGLSVDVAEALTAYANFSRPYKSPNVDDFSAVVPSALGRFVGNVDLTPQQGTEYETGLRFSDPRVGKASASVFYLKIDDEILFNALSFQNQNFDTRRLGLELSAEPNLHVPHLTAQATYTFLESEFRKGPFKGNELPGAPEHALNALLAYEFLPGLFGEIDWRLAHDGFRINDFANNVKSDNYGVLNVGLRYGWRNLTAYFTVENVTDEEYTTFQSSDGTAIATGENPAPPRAYVGGVTVAF